MSMEKMPEANEKKEKSFLDTLEEELGDEYTDMFKGNDNSEMYKKD
jgi:hypothetical protein